MSEDLEVPGPPAAVARKEHCRAAGSRSPTKRNKSTRPPFPTLVDLCRNVINSNLERYPPEAFGIIDPTEWQALVSLRCASTKPRHASASGGLDGTGRLVPAVSDKVLFALEASNLHFAECPVADDLLWKTCVNFKFQRGGLTRPPALNQPWPLLVAEVKGASDTLLSPTATQPERQNAVDQIRQSPMNVALLRDSGVGKSIKKVIKKLDREGSDTSIRNQLEELLSSWRDMAASSGVEMTGKTAAGRKAASAPASDNGSDLKLAERCQSWRQLFAVLKHRNEEVLSSQGKRMREKRQNVSIRLYSMYLSHHGAHCFAIEEILTNLCSLDKRAL